MRSLGLGLGFAVVTLIWPLSLVLIITGSREHLGECEIHRKENCYYNYNQWAIQIIKSPKHNERHKVRLSDVGTANRAPPNWEASPHVHDDGK